MRDPCYLCRQTAAPAECPACRTLSLDPLGRCTNADCPGYVLQAASMRRAACAADVAVLELDRTGAPLAERNAARQHAREAWERAAAACMVDGNAEGADECEYRGAAPFLAPLPASAVASAA
jgi:hypothetical protein